MRAESPTELEPRAEVQSARELPSQASGWGLIFLVSVNWGLAAAGIYCWTKGGLSFQGTSNTLTTVLVVSGVISSILHLRFVSHSAVRGYLARQLLGSGIRLDEFHDVEVALSQSAHDALRSRFRRVRILVLPLVALPVIVGLGEASFKKSWTTGFRLNITTITGADAVFLDPIDISSGSRAAAWPGAILYNTTSGLASGIALNQTSWMYMIATGSDRSGMKPINYYMPSLPALVANGSAGYTSYLATSNPLLAASVQCQAANDSTPSILSADIENTDNNLTTSMLIDGRASIQVQSAAGITWTCTAVLGQIVGSVVYDSDQKGNWNISAVNASLPSSTSPLSFSTSPARLRMMSDIISDCLGSTAEYTGWQWDLSNTDSVGYTEMLIATRLSFAAAVLGYSDQRASTARSDGSPTGTAHSEIGIVVLQANWAFMTTIVLLFLNGGLVLVLILHSQPWGRRIDFVPLQMMQMRRNAVFRRQLPAQSLADHQYYHQQQEVIDLGPRLDGYWKGMGEHYVDDRMVAIRHVPPNEADQFLAVVDLQQYDQYNAMVSLVLANQ